MEVGKVGFPITGTALYTTPTARVIPLGWKCPECEAIWAPSTITCGDCRSARKDVDVTSFVRGTAGPHLPGLVK